MLMNLINLHLRIQLSKYYMYHKNKPCKSYLNLENLIDMCWRHLTYIAMESFTIVTLNEKWIFFYRALI